MKSLLVTIGQLLFSLGLYVMGIGFYGLAFVPGIYIVLRIWQDTQSLSLLLRCIFLGLGLASGYILFGLTLVFLVGGARTILRLRLKEGSHRIISYEAAKWAFISSLYLLINFTFIYFILLTPFANLLLAMLGAKIGKNVQVNSKFVFDASLLEIGDNTVIGGGAVIIGHQVERGVLKLRRVRIGKNVTIGSNAIIPPGCEIGDRAIIGAGAVLLKNTKVQPHSVWYGVPAQNIRKRAKNSPSEEERV
jgi:acetyltransferase-like isoleucine patch superfamily enzyme